MTQSGRAAGAEKGDKEEFVFRRDNGEEVAGMGDESKEREGDEEGKGGR